MNNGRASRLIVGIDPGLSGAVAFIWPNGSVGVEDVPTIRVGKGDSQKRDYAAPLLANLFRQAGACDMPTLVIIERSQAMPDHLKDARQGGSSIWRTGYGFGLWIGVVATLNLPIEFAQPAAWKRVMVGPGAPKDASRLKAIQLFPAAAELLKLKKHHGRAEAMLIAAYGQRKFLGESFHEREF